MPLKNHRLSFCAALICISWATSALATVPRVTALGGAGDYFEDDSSVQRWYGSLGDFGNAVTVDFGHFNIYYGYHDSGGTTISGPSILARYNLGGNLGNLAASWYGQDDVTPTPSLYRHYREESFSLMYSRSVGPLQIGLIYLRSPEHLENHPAWYQTHQTESHRQQWGLGARWQVSPGAYLDFSGDLHDSRVAYYHDSDPGNPESQEQESDLCLNLRTRLFIQLGERTALVPVVEYLTDNRPILPFLGPSIPGIGGHFTRLGCGLNFFPDTDRFLYLAGEWNHGSTEYTSNFDGEETSSGYPWQHQWDSYSLQVGWENRFLPWLTLRSSAGYRLTRGDFTSDPPNRTRFSPDYEDLFYSLGAGLHLKGWDLDAALTEREPFPYFGDWGLHSRSYHTTFLSVSLRYSY